MAPCMAAQVDVLNSQLHTYEGQAADRQRLEAALGHEQRARAEADQRLSKVCVCVSGPKGGALFNRSAATYDMTCCIIGNGGPGGSARMQRRARSVSV